MLRNLAIAAVAVPIVLAVATSSNPAQTSKSSSDSPCKHRQQQTERWDLLLRQNDLVGQAMENAIKETRKSRNLWSLTKDGLLFEQATDKKFPMPALGSPNYAGTWMHRQNERCAAITRYRVMKGLLPSDRAYPEQDRCSQFAAGIWYNEWKASLQSK